MSSRTVTSPTTGLADAGGRAAASARVGMFAPFDLLERGPEAASAFLAQVNQAARAGPLVTHTGGTAMEPVIMTSAIWFPDGRDCQPALHRAAPWQPPGG